MKSLSKLILSSAGLAMSLSMSAENLFVSLLGKTQEQVDERVESVWRHFFTPGDLSRYEAAGEKSVYYLTDDGLSFIMDTGNNDVRTEGMSYGMMISVQLDHRDVFDKLWAWSKKHMAYEESSPWDGYFCWQCRPDGTKLGASNASDGELYYVTSLFLAGQRWNEPSYTREANAILHKIMNKDGEATGVYNLYNNDNYLITFVPDKGGYYFTDPSYHLPAFLQMWSSVADENREFWTNAADAARRQLAASSHPETGLFPDYSEYDGTPFKWRHSGYDTSIYMYDAIRCAMNAGMDYYLTGRDKENQTEYLRRLLRFFKSDDFTHAHFALDGSQAFGDYNEGMAGANAVAAYALASSDNADDRALAKEFVQRLWDTPPPTGKYRYYEGLVYFLSLLHVSGNFSLDFND